MRLALWKIAVWLMIVSLVCALCGCGDPEWIEPGITRVNPRSKHTQGYMAWSPDGRKLAFTHEVGGIQSNSDAIYVLDVATGNLDLVTETDYGDRFVQSWSPDGEQIAFSARIDIEGIWTISPDGQGEPRFLSDGSAVDWSPSGEQIAVYTVSREQKSDPWTRSIWIVTLATGEKRLVFSSSEEQTSGLSLSWSPDGTKLAFDFGAGREGEDIDLDIYTIDLVTGELFQLTHGGFNRHPSWSPDGALIAFVGEPSLALTIARADGSCRIQPLSSAIAVGGPHWSPDGRQIAFKWRGDIYVMDIATVLGEDFISTGPVCP